jgi:hypothetical protein
MPEKILKPAQRSPQIVDSAPLSGFEILVFADHRSCLYSEKIAMFTNFRVSIPAVVTQDFHPMNSA